MDRREFLIGSASCAATLMLPGQAAAQVPVDPPEVRRLKAALEVAWRKGKPLLVFLVPQAPEERWAQGGHFADLLLLSDDAVLAELALAEPCFATEAAVHGVTEPWAFVHGPKQFSLLETSPHITRTSVASWSLPKPWVPYGYTGTELPRGQSYGESSARRMMQSLHGGLAANEGLLEARAGQLADTVRRRRLARTWRRFERDRDLDDEEVFAHAPMITWEALRSGDAALQARATERLAAATRALLVERDPPGAGWVVPSVAPDDFRPGPGGDRPYLVFASGT